MYNKELNFCWLTPIQSLSYNNSTAWKQRYWFWLGAPFINMIDFNPCMDK